MTSPRTIGPQEKTRKITSTGTANTTAGTPFRTRWRYIRFNRRRAPAARRVTGTPVGRVVVVVGNSAPELGIHGAGRLGQQSRDVRLLLAQHGLHHRVERGVHLLSLHRRLRDDLLVGRHLG